METTVKPNRQKEKDNNLVFSYMTMRNLIGFSGMLLPLVLVLATHTCGCDNRIEPSISDYYYTGIGDLLVVILSVLGVFLFTYTGYGWKENILTTIAAICGIGVAFSPTAAKFPGNSFSVHTPILEVPEIFCFERHLLFAAIFFISLSIMSLYYFRKSDSVRIRTKNDKRTQKEKRNIIYKICGWIMIVCVVTLILYFIIAPFKKIVGDFPIIFTLETVAVEAFAISWLTKGETLLPDGEHYMKEFFKMLMQKFHIHRNNQIL